MISLLNILKIAKVEIKKNRSKVEKRVMIVMFVLTILIYLSTSVFVKAGITTTEKYYTFYTENDKLREIILSTGKFVESENADTDLLIDYTDQYIYVFTKNEDRSRAALTVFETAIKQYNALIYGAMTEDKYDTSLVYPLRIKIVPLEREEKTLQTLIATSVERDEVRVAEELAEQEERLAENDSASNVRVEEGFDDTTYEDLADDKANATQVDSNDAQDTAVQNASSSSTGIEDDTLDYAYTSDLNPYSQFQTLLIVILITMPLSMITLIYANSIMAEKINKRGIFLLLAPLKKSEIIIGKTLPYLLGSLAIVIPIVWKSVSNFQDGFYSVLVLTAIIITYLAIGFLVAMLSRSHKELSFLGIFFISLYSCYLLIPAFMLNFSVIALASPLTVVAKLFQAEIVGFDLLGFTIIPTLVAGLSLFYFGSKLFNDINMFSYRNINEKVIDAISQIVRKRRNLFFIALAAIPFVFLIELMMIVFLLSLRSWLAIYILMFFAALTEEVFRNLGVYAIVSRKLEKLTIWKMLLYAGLTGLGFFAGEKILLLLMIAPFVDAYGTLLLAGVALPLFLHSLLTFVFMFAVSKFGKHNFGTAVMLTGLLHFLINFTLSFVLGGGFQ